MIPAEWLISKISVEQAEADNPGITGKRALRHPELARPFGGQNREWESLKAEMQPGDEIWTFASPAPDWRALAGRAGVALVRQGVPIKVVVTLMN